MTSQPGVSLSLFQWRRGRSAQSWLRASVEMRFLGAAWPGQVHCKRLKCFLRFLHLLPMASKAEDCLLLPEIRSLGHGFDAICWQR